MKEQAWEPYDFHRPNKLAREQVRSLDLLHDNFTRRLVAGLGAAVRAVVTADIDRAAQMSWEDYLRTLPSTTVLATMAAPPLPGQMLVEMDTSIALGLVDRLLGGRGGTSPPRRPSELETPALRRVAAVVIDAFGDAISQFLEVEAVFESLELTPQLIALTAPTSMVLVLSYGVQVPSAGIVGEVTVCVPIATLAPALEKLTAHVSERSGPDDEMVVMTGVVHGLSVEIEAQLRATQLTAAQVAALQPGDVVVLDHRITDPAIGLVAQQPVFTAHVGRRGRRFAVAVAEHPFGDDVMRGPRELVGSHGQP